MPEDQPTPAGSGPAHSGYSYPADLARFVRNRWRETPVPSGDSASLPDVAALEGFLATCYQASMLREEERPVIFRAIHINVVAEDSNGDEAVREAAEHAPDVALMDLIMPGTDGGESPRRLKDRSPRTRVIVLTSYHDDEHIFPAIRAGALSYVLCTPASPPAWCASCTARALATAIRPTPTASYPAASWGCCASSPTGWRTPR